MHAQPGSTLQCAAAIARFDVAVVTLFGAGDRGIPALDGGHAGLPGRRTREIALDLRAIRGAAVTRHRVAVVALFAIDIDQTVPAGGIGRVARSAAVRRAAPAVFGSAIVAGVQAVAPSRGRLTAAARVASVTAAGRHQPTSPGDIGGIPAMNHTEGGHEGQ